MAGPLSAVGSEFDSRASGLRGRYPLQPHIFVSSSAVQEGQLSFTGKRMCTKYWLSSKPDRPEMTIADYRGCKTTTPTQQQQHYGITIDAAFL